MLPTLKKTRHEVETLISARATEAAGLIDQAAQVTDDHAATNWRYTFERWRDKTRDTLLACYSTDGPAEQFTSAARRPRAGAIALGPVPWNLHHDGRVQRVRDGMNVLRSLLDRLELLTEPGAAGAVAEADDTDDRDADTSKPQCFINEVSHEWALRNRPFLELVFESFDQEADWPALHGMQRRLIRAGERTNVTQPAYELPRELGYREAPPDERVVLSVFALRYVDAAAAILDDFMRVFRLAVDRYRSTDEAVTLTRADLTDTLGLSDEQATKLSRILVRGTRFLSGGRTDLESWELSVHEPGLVALLDATTVDEYLAADAELLGLTRAALQAAPDAALDLGIVDDLKPVFLVHGHDEAVKHKVARFLEKVTMPGVTILDEQPGKGRTLIEKFEAYASAAGYAVVLLTGDDEGREKGEEDWKPRARQNVILELGFFVAKLGRGNVAMLYEANVERPSDIEGVVYLPLDAADAWKTKLAREMREAGVSIYIEKALTS